MDGPLAGFDIAFYFMCLANNWELDVDHWTKQRFRYFTDHIQDDSQRRASMKVIEAEGWFRDLPVVEGSQEGVEALLSAGWEIHVCTKPMDTNPTCRDEKAAWLKEHFPDIATSMITAPDKSMIVGDVLLDDDPKLKWLERAQWVPIVFTAPYNTEGALADLTHWTWGDDPMLIEAWTIGGVPSTPKLQSTMSWARSSEEDDDGQPD